VEHDTDRGKVPDLTMQFVICLLSLCGLSSDFLLFLKTSSLHINTTQRFWRICIMGNLYGAFAIVYLSIFKWVWRAERY